MAGISEHVKYGIDGKWWMYLDYDQDLFEYESVTNEDIIENAFISVKFPYDFENGGQYRETKIYENMKFHNTDTEKTVAIPLIVVSKTTSEKLNYMYIALYNDNQYGVTQYGGTGHRYRWSVNQYEDNPIYSLPTIHVEGDEYYDEEYTVPVSEGSIPFYIKTNLPIFEVTQDFDINNSLVEDYQKTHNIQSMLDYSEVIGILNNPKSETIKEWYIYNEFKSGTASILEGFVPSSTALLQRRYETIKTRGQGRLSLVMQQNGSYTIVPDTGVEIIGSEYGNHTIYDLTPYENVIQYYGPFYNEWDGRTTGNITCATRANSNMWWYATEADRKSVENKSKKPEEVAIKGPDDGGNETNPTGPRERKTTMSNPTWKNMCINQYIMSESEMSQLANKIFTTDDTEIEALVKGIGTMFSKPIDAIISIVYYPFNLADYTTISSANYLYIGGWNSGMHCNKILTVTKRVTIGEFYFSRSNNDFRDFYTQSVQIWLPYIGMKQLDIKRFMGTKLRVEYAFDLYTNQCTAFLFSDDILVDYYNGVIGINVPLTAINYGEFASSAIRLCLAGGAIVGSAIATGGGSIGIGATLGIAGAGFAPQVADTLNMNNYREQKGGLTSYINGFAPQYVYLLFEELQPDDSTEYIQNLRGLPSNYSGIISEFSGFLSVSNVNLVCGGATETEKQEILSYLNNGIYI